MTTSEPQFRINPDFDESVVIKTNKIQDKGWLDSTATLWGDSDGWESLKPFCLSAQTTYTSAQTIQFKKFNLRNQKFTQNSHHVFFIVDVNFNKPVNTNTITDDIFWPITHLHLVFLSFIIKS